MFERTTPPQSAAVRGLIEAITILGDRDTAASMADWHRALRFAADHPEGARYLLRELESTIATAMAMSRTQLDTINRLQSDWILARVTGSESESEAVPHA